MYPNHANITVPRFLSVTPRRIIFLLSAFIILAVVEDVLLLRQNRAYRRDNQALVARLTRIVDSPDLEQLVGIEAPEFQLVSLSNLNISPSSYQDKDLILVFFTVNCPACIASARDWGTAYQRYGLREAELVGISLDSREELLAFRDEYELDLSICSDSKGEVFEQYEVPGVPLVVWINRQGLIENVEFF